MLAASATTTPALVPVRLRQKPSRTTAKSSTHPADLQIPGGLRWHGSASALGRGPFAGLSRKIHVRLGTLSTGVREGGKG